MSVAKHGSFTRAAAELFLTQPTISGHILALENELGAVLLNRSGKTVTLTQAGQVLYSHAVNILNLREQASFSLAQHLGKLEGELSIAASTIPQRYLLPGLLAALSREYPGLTYYIRQYDSKGVVEAIISGAMDFGFVGAVVSYPELEMLKLCADRLILITASAGKYLTLTGPALSWDQVAKEKFILREPGSGTRALFERALAQKGISINDLTVVASVENPETIKAFVREGLGVAIASERSVHEEIQLGQLRGFQLPELSLSRDFYFICHRNRVLSPAERAFRDFIEQYRQDL